MVPDVAARVAPARPADGYGRGRVAPLRSATCRGVAVTARASTSGSSAPEPAPGAVVRAVLGADDKAWTHIVSSPEGREMVEMRPRALTMRLLALRDALQRTISEPELVASLRAQARARSDEMLSWDEVTDRTEALYLELAARKGAGRANAA